MANIAIHTYGSAAVLKGGIEFGAEPTSLVDRSGYGNHGVYTDIVDSQLSSDLWVLGYNGATSSIDCGIDASLNVFTAQTRMCWIKRNDAGNAEMPISLVNAWWQITSSSFMQGNFATSGNSANSISNETIAQDIWTLIELSYDDNGDRKIHLFKNNVEVTYSTQTTATGTLTSNAGLTLYVGDYSSGSYNVDGYIAIPRVFPYALSQAQRTKIWTTERPLLYGGGNRIAIAPGASAKIAVY